MVYKGDLHKYFQPRWRSASLALGRQTLYHLLRVPSCPRLLPGHGQKAGVLLSQRSKQAAWTLLSHACLLDRLPLYQKMGAVSPIPQMQKLRLEEVSVMV